MKTVTLQATNLTKLSALIRELEEQYGSDKISIISLPYNGLVERCKVNVQVFSW